MRLLVRHPKIHSEPTRNLCLGALVTLVPLGSCDAIAIDCSQAKLPSEHAICDRPSLKVLDEQLDSLYAATRRALPAPLFEEIKRSQIEWIRERNERCGGDVGCLGTAIDSRIVSLRKIIDSSSAAATGRPGEILRLTPQLNAQMFGERMTFVPILSDCAPSSEKTLYAVGQIQRGSSTDLKNALTTLGEGTKSVFLNSPGGDFWEGIRMGVVLREMSVTTLTGGPVNVALDCPSNQKTVAATTTICASSCAYAFLGGSQRYLLNDRAYGVHQFYTMVGVSKETDIQYAIANVGAYLRKMGVSANLIEIASSTPPTEIHFVDRRAAAELKISATVYLDGNWEIHRSNGTTSVSFSSAQSAVGIALAVYREEDGFGLLVARLYRDQTMYVTCKNDRLWQHGALQVVVGNDARDTSLTTVLTSKNGWIFDPESHAYRAYFHLTADQFSSMRNGSSLAIATNYREQAQNMNCGVMNIVSLNGMAEAASIFDAPN
ncbi:MAG: hypothetical protein P4L92_14365 [Rudaea sp.]|nr:hypothetical protein [Rudaea sp.]